MAQKVTIIGAGLAGCEAAYQLAKRGIKVNLVDIKPKSFTPAHKNPNYAEIVCSNSLKSQDITTASGVLKKELEILDSLILKTAKTCSVPAGNALAVDRDEFAKKVTNQLKIYKNINFICKKIRKIPKGVVIIATGPLTTPSFLNEISKFLDSENLHFFDASSPIVDAETLDKNVSFIKDRYDKGTNNGDYINCPMTKEEYLLFYENLVNAQKVELKNFEKKEIFESCMPIEVLASRGQDSLRYGPLKPIGLNHPVTGQKYYAVVQLRRESNTNSLYNMVGFQTNLTFGEQKRVFGLIPALKNANFVKYGVMHRNSYVEAPKVLKNTFQTKINPNVFIAGQLGGVEGYMESVASGLVAGINAFCLLTNRPFLTFDSTTVLGAMINYITTCNLKNFQPMNANFGILEPLAEHERDEKLRKQKLANRAIENMKKQVKAIDFIANTKD